MDFTRRADGRMVPAVRLALVLLNLAGLLLCGSLVALLRGFSLSWLHNASVLLNGLAALALLLALGAAALDPGRGWLRLAALRANQLLLAACLGLAGWNVAAKPAAAAGAAVLVGMACVFFGANIACLRRPAPRQDGAMDSRP
ncbi:MAG: hypothetical protein V4679_15860 [Pseudomonadota bacterium]